MDGDRLLGTRRRAEPDALIEMNEIGIPAN
jgi:hypothetical protein